MKYCSEFVHNGVSCVQNKKLLVQKLAVNNASYADVMKNPNVSRAKSSSTKPLPPTPLAPSLDQKQQTTTTTTRNNPPELSGPSASDAMPPPACATDAEPCNIPTKPIAPEGDSDHWVRVTRRSAKKTDGNETDSSTSSKNSIKRPAGKKMRCGGSDDSNNTDTHP